MNGGNHGDTQSFPEKHPVPQALVVMKDVEMMKFGQFPQLQKGPETEGLDLRKDPETGGGEFVKIQGREDFEGLGEREKVFLLPEEIKIFHPVNDGSVQE
jgi:hypothetical protein